MKTVSDKNCREIRNTHFMSNNIFFLENRAVYKIMWKNIVDPDRSQMIIQRMRISCWIIKATKTLRICNNYCFSTATMVARRRLNVTLYVRWLSCFADSFTAAGNGTRINSIFLYEYLSWFQCYCESEHKRAFKKLIRWKMNNFRCAAGIWVLCSAGKVMNSRSNLVWLCILFQKGCFVTCVSTVIRARLCSWVAVRENKM